MPAPAGQSPPQTVAPGTGALDVEAYDVDGNTLLDQVTVESAVYPYLGPQRTKQDVFAARDALQKAYRDKGYQSVNVDVPAQDARSGIVRLHVVEAPVGRFRVVGSNYTSIGSVKEQIPAFQEGKVPDFNQAQQQMTELNRLPDRRVTPLIKPGKIPGTVDIDLKVNDALPVHGSFEVNNDHAQNTTPVRTTATVSYGNLWQLGHTISFTALVAPKNLGDAQVYSGSYMAPIWGTPWSILAYAYDSNSSVATLGGTDVLGKGYAGGLRGILQLPTLGDFAESLSAGADFKHFLEQLTLGSSNTGAIVEYVPLVAAYTLQGTNDVSSATANLAVTLGVRGPGSGAAAFENKRAFATSNFVHANIDADVSQNLFDIGQIGIRLSGQIADQPLVSSEQFSAGGLTSVRGYLQSEALGDDGWFSSIELRTASMAPFLDDLIDAPVFDELRFYQFTDSAQTWVLDALPEQQHIFRLTSTGVGARVRMLSHLVTELDLAVPLRDSTATKAWQPYFQFSVKSEL